MGEDLLKKLKGFSRTFVVHSNTNLYAAVAVAGMIAARSQEAGHWPETIARANHSLMKPEAFSTSKCRSLRGYNANFAVTVADGTVSLEFLLNTDRFDMEEAETSAGCCRLTNLRKGQSNQSPEGKRLCCARSRVWKLYNRL